VLVSVGGGGLIAGIAAWCGGRCRVEALEPERRPRCMRRAPRGEPVDVRVGGLAADSLGAQRIGAHRLGPEPALRGRQPPAADEAIRAAQLRLWRDLRLAVEPAAALGLAALWSGAVRPAPASAWPWCCAAPTSTRPRWPDNHAATIANIQRTARRQRCRSS
jgi:threonine dehydratase